MNPKPPKHTPRHPKPDDVRPAEDAHDHFDPAGDGTPRSKKYAGNRNSGPKRHPDTNADYEVGYGRPPKHTRFAPGKSGNPKGRLPKSQNMKTIVAKVLAEQVQIRDGGRLKRMTKMEAAVRMVVSRLFKSDPKGMASFFIMMKQSGFGNEHAENSPELLEGLDYEAVLEDYLARVEPGGKTSPDASSEESDSPDKRNA